MYYFCAKIRNRKKYDPTNKDPADTHPHNEKKYAQGR